MSLARPVESRKGAGTHASMAPFPFPAHRTGRAVFPHPALRQSSPQGARRRPRIPLRLAIQLSLKCPDSFWCLQTFVNHRTLTPLKAQLEVRVLPSTGITRLPRYYGPLRRPNGPPTFLPTLESPPSVPGLPQLPRPPCLHAIPNTPADRTAALVGYFPIPAAFPVFQAGRRPRLHFRGLLRIHSRYGLHARSPAFQRGLSPGFDMTSSLDISLVSYRPYRQLAGWLPPPQVIRAIGAH